MQGRVVESVGNILTVLHTRDPTVAVVSAKDQDTVAHTRQQIPPDPEDLIDDWMHFDHKNTAFRDTVPEGKTRTFRGTMMIGTNWEPKRLINKTELAMDKIGVTLSYNEIQKIRMEKFWA